MQQAHADGLARNSDWQQSPALRSLVAYASRGVFQCYAVKKNNALGAALAKTFDQAKTAAHAPAGRKKEVDISPFQSDIETLRVIDPTGGVRHQKGRYVLRLDLHFPAPAFERPTKLGPIFQRAIALMGDAMKTYASEGPFARSAGRKPRKTDIAQFGKTDVLLKSVWSADVEELRMRRDQIEKLGQETLDENFKPIDYGNAFLGDRLPISSSDTHFQLRGSGGWALSFSFGLDLVAKKAQETLSFAEDVLASGLAASGFFGFAINVHDGLSEEACAAAYLDSANRFPLINPVNPSILAFLDSEERGIAPIGPWYSLENDWAIKNGLNPDEIVRAVSGQAHAIINTPNGHLFKLWESPILGEKFGVTELSPTLALGRALSPAIKAAYRTDWDNKKQPHPLHFCSVGNYEQRYKFYTRFCQSETW